MDNSVQKDRDATPSMARQIAGEHPSVFTGLLSTRAESRGVTVSDAAGLICGFAVAGLLVRGTILVKHEIRSISLTVVSASLYVWLGLAISGPFVSGLRRIQHGRRWKFSIGETIWVGLGLLWLVVGMLRRLRWMDSNATTHAACVAAVAAGLAPLLCLVAWRAGRTTTGRVAVSWCDRAGIICAACWPAAWALAAFLLGL